MLYIEMLDKVQDYQEAIRKSCNILEKHKIIKSGYYEDILQTIRVYGGYFYLGRGVCMPHADVSEKTPGTAACILKLEEPVDFLGRPVKIFITFAAGNAEEHMELLKKITRAFSDRQNLLRLQEAKTTEEIRMIMEG